MEDYLILFIMTAVLVGGSSGYRYLRFRRREREYSPERQWQGHGIDVSRVMKQVRRVRNDYASELQSRPHGTLRREGLLASMRKVVGRLPYFRRHPQKAASTAHDTEHHPA